MTDKLRLSIQDLLVLRSLLLELGGNYAELQLATATIERVFSEKDMADYQVAQTPNGIVWQMTGKDKKPLPAFREVELGPEAMKMLFGALVKLDEAKALQRVHMTLYELLVVRPTEKRKAEAAV
jgi:hypothetical protein